MDKAPQLDEVCELNRGCLQCQLSISGHLDCLTSEILQNTWVWLTSKQVASFDQFYLESLAVWGSTLLLLLARFLHHLLVHPVKY